MNTYEGLTQYLLKSNSSEFILTFAEIEEHAGVALPLSKERPQYWENSSEPRGVNKAAREGGYSTFLLKGLSKVRFVRDQ